MKYGNPVPNSALERRRTGALEVNGRGLRDAVGLSTLLMIIISFPSKITGHKALPT